MMLLRRCVRAMLVPFAVVCVLVLLERPAHAGDGAPQLTLEQVDALIAHVTCVDGCMATADNQRAGCRQACGSTQTMWDRNHDNAIDGLDRALAALEYWDDGRHRDICMPLADARAKGTVTNNATAASLNDTVNDTAVVQACGVAGVEQCAAFYPPSQCVDADADHLPVWLEQRLGTSDVQPQEQCEPALDVKQIQTQDPSHRHVQATPTTECDFYSRCSDVPDVQQHVCLPRLCNGATCPALALQLVNADEHEVIVTLVLEHAPWPVNGLDVVLLYSDHDLALRNFRGLESTLKQGKNVTVAPDPDIRSNDGRRALRIRVAPQPSAMAAALPFGAVAELVFDRKVNTATELDFSADPQVLERAMLGMEGSVVVQQQLHDVALWRGVQVPVALFGGLLLHYTFDDAHIPSAADILPNDADLCRFVAGGCGTALQRNIAYVRTAPVNLTPWADGVSGAAARFDGRNHVIRVPWFLRNDPLLSSNQSFSVSGWFFVDRTAHALEHLLFVERDGVTEASRLGVLVARDPKDSTLSLEWFDNSNTLTQRTKLAHLPRQTWQHLAVVYDASHMLTSIYLNGVAVGALSTPKMFCPALATNTALRLYKTGEMAGTMPERVWLGTVRNDQFAIETMSPHGRERQVVYQSPYASYRDPAFNTSRGKLAFVSDQGGQFDLWLADREHPEDTVCISKSKGKGQLRQPRWSPAGNKLLYISQSSSAVPASLYVLATEPTVQADPTLVTLQERDVIAAYWIDHDRIMVSSRGRNGPDWRLQEVSLANQRVTDRLTMGTGGTLELLGLGRQGAADYVVLLRQIEPEGPSKTRMTYQLARMRDGVWRMHTLDLAPIGMVDGAVFAPHGDGLLLSVHTHGTGQGAIHGPDDGAARSTTGNTELVRVDVNTGAVLQRIPTGSRVIAGLDWVTDESLITCHEIGGYTDPTSRQIMGGLEGGIDDVRVYGYARAATAIAAEADAGRALLLQRHADNDIALSGNMSCSANHMDCPPYHLCSDDNVCVMVPCSLSNSHGCSTGQCTLAPAAVGGAVGGVCTVECTQDSDCYGQSCGGGNCAFCDGDSGSCRACQTRVTSVGGIALSESMGCGDSDAFVCAEDGACESACYQNKNGEERFVCTADQICTHGACASFRWQWSHFQSATWSALGDDTQTSGVEQQGITSMYRVAITAYGSSDYLRSPRIVVEGLPVANTVGVGDNGVAGNEDARWIPLGDIAVHARNANAPGHYTVLTPWPMAKIRVQLAQTSASDSVGALGYPMRTPMGSDGIGTIMDTAGPAGFTSSTGVFPRGHLIPGRSVVIVSDVSINDTAPVRFSNRYCSYAGYDTPWRNRQLLPVDGSRLTGQSRTDPRGAEGILNCSARVPVVTADASPDVANSAAMDTASVVYTFPAVAPWRDMQRNVNDHTGTCSYVSGVDSACFTWLQRDQSLDPLNGATQSLFDTFVFSDWSTFGVGITAPEVQLP